MLPSYPSFETRNINTSYTLRRVNHFSHVRYNSNIGRNSVRYRGPIVWNFIGTGVAQLVSARLSEQEVPGSILGDFNVCFDFPLIRVAIALNTRKTEH